MLPVLSLAYVAMILGVIAFQVALIAGAPWGHLTQGGRRDGPLDAVGRWAAAVSILLLVLMALAMLSASGGWPGWPRWTGWAVVATNLAMMAANWATPSVPERRLWGPVTTVMAALALLIMMLG